MDHRLSKMSHITVHEVPLSTLMYGSESFVLKGKHNNFCAGWMCLGHTKNKYILQSSCLKRIWLAKWKEWVITHCYKKKNDSIKKNDSEGKPNKWENPTSCT